MLVQTGSVQKRDMTDRALDLMERGITIKAPAGAIFHLEDGDRSMLNLIDTPGLVDVNGEVEKRLQACEGRRQPESARTSWGGPTA